ncbi:DUF3367 domain-containing protein [Corynebacterium sp. 35RC1]|nr:DUF3367 domain-containing protein [Corynebacterium sp. 35RC1]
MCFLPQPGRIAADTKLDLSVDPLGFLAQAAHAWTDAFPMGQLQNQAYGYFFPQGLFFVLTQPLPDWVAQRLWWTIVLGVGFSGFLLLVQRARIGSQAPVMQVLAAALFALSPRTLSTLTTISSETWPIMLVPWTLLPLLERRPRVGASVLAVAMMGAVNATATLSACLPAAILLLWRRAPRALALWLAGCALVSLWWLVPLVVLGRYAPPFLEYIESAYVTTRWLNLPEILRGTTSWVPFVEVERQAGHLLVTEPTFVVLTLAVATLGMIGLVRVRYRGLWLSLLAVGLLILATGPLLTSFYDGPAAALRNLHKFDSLVRLPLMVGVAALPVHRLREMGRAVGSAGSADAVGAVGSDAARRAQAATLLCVLLGLGATAPAWSGRLMPTGTWTALSADWQAAADYVNQNASPDTRTLIWPGRSFAREDWGWTRDEPAQVLLDGPWLVRDAIPLVPPEAIRALDAISLPNSLLNRAALDRLGVGAVIVRETPEDSDLDLGAGLGLDEPAVQFGELRVVLLDDPHSMQITSAPPVAVAGSGEIMAELPSGMYQLNAQNPEIFTDTPLLIARNYGAVERATSAPLASLDEASDVHNIQKNYATTIEPIPVTEVGGTVRASSQASDATSIGGANPEESVSAAVDDQRRTAWYPTPGTGAGQWLELQPHEPVQDPVLLLETTGNPVEVTISNGQAELTRRMEPKTPARIRVPGASATAVRITLHGRAGVANAQLEGAEIRRIIDLGVIPESTRQLILHGERTLTLTRPMDVGTTTLAAGTHTLGPGVYTEVGFEVASVRPTGTSIEAAASERTLNTTRAFNEGLRGYLDNTELQAVEVNAAQQGFVIPAGASGEFRMEFAGNTAYRIGLIGGGLLALGTVLVLLVLLVRGRDSRRDPMDDSPSVWIRRWALRRTLITPADLIVASMGIVAMWCARGPWPSAQYVGDSPAAAAMCLLALAALYGAGSGAGAEDAEQ